MGLLDGYLSGEWRGLLNAPISQGGPSPRGLLTPLFASTTADSTRSPQWSPRVASDGVDTLAVNLGMAENDLGDGVPWQHYANASNSPKDSDPIEHNSYGGYASVGNERRGRIDQIDHSMAAPFGFDILNPARSEIPGLPNRPRNNELPSGGAPFHLAQALFPPISLFARPPIYIPRNLTPLEKLPPGSANGPRAGMPFPREMAKPKSPEEYPPCTYCSEETGPGNYHRDHIIPRVQEGDGSLENLGPSCASCNLHKGPRTPTQWYGDMLNGVI